MREHAIRIEQQQRQHSPLLLATKGKLAVARPNLKWAGQQALSMLATVAQQVRTLELRLGTEMEKIPELFSRALEA